MRLVSFDRYVSGTQHEEETLERVFVNAELVRLVQPSSKNRSFIEFDSGFIEVIGSPNQVANLLDPDRHKR